MQIEIISVIDGYIIKENVTGGKFTKTFKKTLSDVADHIDPRHPRTVASQYDIAHDIHLQEVASKAKPEIQASDFLKAEAAKAQSYKCTAPPYPSNQANLQNMAGNLNCAPTPFMNANDYLAGKQFNISGSAIGGVQQHDKKSLDAELTKAQFDNFHPARVVEIGENSKKLAGIIRRSLAEQDKIQRDHDAEHKPEPFITEKVRHMIEFAVRAGYGNNLARFAADVQTLKEHANLQDDGK